MDTIFRVIIWIIAAVFAYSVVASERRARAWSPLVIIGVYLTFFGATTFALLNVYNFFSPKITDGRSFPSETDWLVGGLVVLTVVVVLALDLLDKIDIMGQIQRAVSGNNPPPGRGPNSGSF
ncbi:MAG: hypothetical protein DCC58_15770 [Chloroflexi bacterium]|nr:MAG: hypothetical protein DCC58_15770 [Chloroflexota bacterium]